MAVLKKGMGLMKKKKIQIIFKNKIDTNIPNNFFFVGSIKQFSKSVYQTIF